MSLELSELSFDRAAFLLNFQGMEDLAEEAISSFLGTLPKSMSLLQAAIEAGNASELELRAHSLRGSLSNYHAKQCCLIAWRLEQIGSSGSTSDAKMFFTTLSQEIDRLANDLRQLSENLKNQVM
jgi:HPt (histidine-containing phosphotransfer) domain-containing protein